MTTHRWNLLCAGMVVIIFGGLCLFSRCARAASPRDNVDTLIRMDKVLSLDLSVYPSIIPTSGKVTSGFGFRRDPFTRGIRWHAGIDICNVEGTPVYASGAGTVIFTGYQQGYGWCIEIRHTRRTTSFYAHLETIGVYKGENVKRGELIGLMGCTGTRSTGDHVHYEIRIDGMAVDPKEVLW